MVSSKDKSRLDRALGEPVPHYRTLNSWADELGDGFSVSSLRRECMAGRLEFIRTRPAPNAKILISEEAMRAWIRNYASTWRFMTRGGA